MIEADKRKAVFLLHQDGMSGREISRRLGISRSSVEVIIDQRGVMPQPVRKDKQLIDFYETRDREVILYFRSLGPKAVKEIELDLMATVPGDFVAPASRAYLYYTAEYKHWAEPLRVTVAR